MSEVASLDVEQIKKLLPHRAPMLLVERLEEIVPFESAVGYKAVSINEPWFAGHFPERAVMPGVLIIESMAQTAAVLVVLLGWAGRPRTVDGYPPESHRRGRSASTRP